MQKRVNATILYIYNTDTRLENPEIKIGYTINLHSRINQFKKVCAYGKLEFTIEVGDQDVKILKDFISEILIRYKIRGDVFQVNILKAKFAVLRVVNTLKLCNIENAEERRLKLKKSYEDDLEIIDNVPRVKTQEIGIQCSNMT